MIVAKSKSKSKSRPKKARQPKPIRKLVVAHKPKEWGKRHVSTFEGFGYPDELRCCLKYVSEDMSFLSVSAGTAQVFRGNSLFDPDLTNAGHQPQQFDQLAAVYGQYCVEGVAVKAQIVTTSTGVCASHVLCITDTNQSAQSVEDLHEGRWSKGAQTGPDSAMNKATLSLPPTNLAMIQGGKDIKDDPNNYSAIGSNPVDPVFVIFKTRSIDGVSAVDTFVTFTLEYQCVFRELTINSESAIRRCRSNQAHYIEYLKTKALSKAKLFALQDYIEELSKTIGPL